MYPNTTTVKKSTIYRQIKEKNRNPVKPLAQQLERRKLLDKKDVKT